MLADLIITFVCFTLASTQANVSKCKQTTMVLLLLLFSFELAVGLLRCLVVLFIVGRLRARRVVRAGFTVGLGIITRVFGTTGFIGTLRTGMLIVVVVHLSFFLLLVIRFDVSFVIFTFGIENLLGK